MNLERTRQLIHEGIDADDPMGSLVHVLESAIELVSVPDNDFTWSYWENAEEATEELKKLLRLVEEGELPDRIQVAVIFAPTGPLQEVSLGSGWPEAFLVVAEKFDEVQQLLWNEG